MKTRVKNGQKYVSYLRVSTKEQGIEGLGIGAQREAIKLAVTRLSGRVVAEFVEAISGKEKYRPELLKALALCQDQGYILVVSQLDRLGRDASYLFQIRDNLKRAEVFNLYVVDHPDMDTMQFGMYATMCQHERERISQRTKVALQERFRRTGKKNGNQKGCDMSYAQQVAILKRKEKAMLDNNNVVAKNIIQIELEKGTPYRKIAEYMNTIGIKTPTGKTFSVSAIQRIMKVYGMKKPTK